MSRGGGATVLPAGMTDEQCREAILDYVLALHPSKHLTIPGLIQEMVAGSVDFNEGPQLECAVRDLIGEGLLSCRRGLLCPTQLALGAEEPVCW